MLRVANNFLTHCSRTDAPAPGWSSVNTSRTMGGSLGPAVTSTVAASRTAGGDAATTGGERPSAGVPYSHPWWRASRIASMRLRVPVLPMADER